MTYAQLMKLRERLTDFSMDGGSEGKAAGVARNGLDDFLSNLRDDQLATNTLLGPPTMTGQQAGALFKEARANMQGAFKSDELVGGLGKGDTGMLQQADTRAAVTNSGQNAGNLIGQRVAAFLRNEDNLKGYSPEEIAALRDVANTGNVQGLLRYLGNRGTIMSAIGALFGGGGAESAIGVGAGQSLARMFKGAEAGIQRRALQSVDELVRSNTPLGQRSPTQLVNPPASGRLLPPGLLAPAPQNRQPIPYWQLKDQA